jgi:phage tail sheath gpL-like
MPISFSQIPANIKVPLYWVEVDPSMAGLPSINLRAILAGQMFDTGDAEPNVPIPIGSQSQADQRFGEGSELSRMFKAFYANNFANEVWGVGLPEPAGASAAAGAITITAQPTNAGTIHLYIGGEYVPINISPTDDIPTIAAAIVDEINNTDHIAVTAAAGAPSAPHTITAATWTAGNATFTTSAAHGVAVGGQVTIAGVTPSSYNGTYTAGTGTTGSTIVAPIASDPGTYVSGGTATGVGAGGVVTLTTNWKGIGGNEIQVSLNYYGGRGGEQTPVGLGITLPATGFLTGGVGTPSVEDAITNMGEEPFEYFCCPYTDSESLFNLDQEYGFTDNGRWGWRRELFGHVLTAKRGTYADLLLFGETNNSGVISIMGFEVASPSPSFEWAAAYTAKAQRALINDPARPLQSLSLNQIKLAPIHERFDFVELNSLASTGIAIQKAGSDRQPMIAREQTTYQLNLYGQSDDAYELITTLATLAKVLRNQRHAITSKFPRHKLANDGTKFGPGQAIVTPIIIKAELINQYQQDMYDGLVEDLQNFKAHLLVERDTNNPNRLNVLYPPDLINQLRIFAVLAQFRLQYDRGIDTLIVGPTSGPFNAASQAA